MAETRTEALSVEAVTAAAWENTLRNEILKDRTAVELFLKIGEKLGVFECLPGAKKIYRHPGAMQALALVVDDAISKGEDMSKIQAEFVSGNGSSHLKQTSTSILAAKIKQKIKEARSANDSEAVEIHQGNLDFLTEDSATDQITAAPFSLDNFEAISDQYLPPWSKAIQVLANKHEIVGPEAIRKFLGLDPEIEAISTKGHADLAAVSGLK